MLKFTKIVIFIFPFLVCSQNIKVTILDLKNKRPLNGIQILSNNGSLITKSNIEGKFEFEKSILKQSKIKSIIVYDSEYLPIEHQTDEIPSIIYLEKINSIQLNPVIIIRKKSNKYFTIKGYFRSWKLIDNKLVKYSDGMITYHIPYESANRNNFNTGIKNYATQFRTFIADSTKKEHSKFAIYLNDNYLQTNIPIRDRMSFQNTYKLEKINDSVSSVFAKNKKGEYSKEGYALYDENQNIKEVQTQVSFEGDETIKILFWKISGKFQEIEKWTGTGETRHPSYLFSSKKAIVKTKIEGKFNAEETINEIFIDDKIIHNDKKPEKCRTIVERNKSFYNTQYWKEQIEKHPLPSGINEQLNFLMENKNSY